ncbi:hypothetical protein PCASD_10834 [Puccinia coronata f. sp. avenae]|nr:hypothetical protein PCASD_10834 [Puccinia coronata f. sp. avenae]
MLLFPSLLFFGSDNFSAKVLNQLLIKIKLINNNNNKNNLIAIIPAISHKGRGRTSLYQPPLLTLVQSLGLPHQSLPRTARPLTDWQIPDEFKQSDTVLVSASFPYWIPRSITTQVGSHRALNVHPSLLPRYRGAAPIQWQIANQEHETGVSIQTIGHHGFDSGIILSQKLIQLSPTTTYHLAEQSLANLAAELLVDLIPNIDSYIASAWPQDSSKASYAPKIGPLDLRIDASWSASKVAARSRGMSHQYPLNIQINGEVYQIQVELPDSPEAREFGSRNQARLAVADPGELVLDRAQDRVGLRLIDHSPIPTTTTTTASTSNNNNNNNNNNENQNSHPPPPPPVLIITKAKLVRAGGKGWLAPLAWWDRLFNTAAPHQPDTSQPKKSLKTFRVHIDHPQVVSP